MSEVDVTTVAIVISAIVGLVIIWIGIGDDDGYSW